MPNTDPLDAARLRRFNRQVIDQALALVASHDGPDAPAFDGPVGAHLRHVIEHYDALLAPRVAGAVDYDQRPRDRELERCHRLPRQRLLARRQRLADDGADALDAPLRVLGRAGLAGDFEFAVISTLGRELVFVGSHAVHHFALLKAHCLQHGLVIDPQFGKAPATVAHDAGVLPQRSPATAAHGCSTLQALSTH